MKRIKVDVEGAKNKAVSYQCICGEFEFEDTSSQKVITELRAKEYSIVFAPRLKKQMR